MSIDHPEELTALEAAGRVVAETPGLVITIEPIIAADGWTVRTDDGSPSAHAEHTLVVTEGAPVLVTA